jgi:phospholipid-binding lipoprotein MlaA
MRPASPRKLLHSGLLASCFLLTLAAAGLGGCAHRPTDPEALQEYEQNNDPLEPTNRVFYKVNNAIATAVLAPAARGYRYVVPQPGRNGVHTVLANLSSPVLFANDVMQTKPRRAGDTLMRFLINTTVGVVGIFDVATGWGYPAHDSDFGVTLALWGLQDGGPFLFLPVLGPSDPRDAIGFGADIVMDPFTWVGQGAAVTALGWSRFAVSAVDARERHLDDIELIMKTALDPYATFRSLYQQHRKAQIDETRNDNRSTTPIWFPSASHPANNAQ